jgi:hypothetical protein
MVQDATRFVTELTLMRLLPLLFWLLAPCSLLHAAAGAPNIIIHFLDALGYGDIGPFGG